MTVSHSSILRNGHEDKHSLLGHVHPKILSHESSPGISSGERHGTTWRHLHRKWSFFAVVAVFVVLVLVSTIMMQRKTRDTSYRTRMNFVTVDGTVFMDGEEEFRVAGFNVYNVVERWMISPDEVQHALDTLSKDGVSVIRIFAHTTNPEYPFQSLHDAREYNDAAFRALDDILYLCEKRNIRVLMSLADTWMYHGGVQWYVDLSETLETIPDAAIVPQGDFDFSKLSEEQTAYLKKRQTMFFHDTGARDLYKHHIRTILERPNSRKGGLMYKDDPTIFGFGLLNEMRCELKYDANCETNVPKFLEDITRYFRSIDLNHLLTVGEEGFYSSSSPSRADNPGTWAEGQGQDFLRDHSIEGISYASIHVWSKNWEAADEIGFLKKWIQSHMNITSNILGVPLLVEEIGRKMDTENNKAIRSERDPVIQTAFSQVEDSLSQHGVLSGALLWEYSIGETAVSPYTIRHTSSTYKLFRQHARNMLNRHS